MSVHISILSSSKGLKPYALQLSAITKSVEAAVRKLLPVKDIDVVFYDNPEGTIEEVGGIGGFTPSANTVFISLNPRHKHFKRALKEELAYTLAHEFHHAIRFRTPIKKETLLEAIISEGLADHFALEVTGRKKPAPWCIALTRDQKEALLKRASKEWNEEGYDHHAWFYGSALKKLPRWTGYALGYDLVEKYLAVHPRASASTLVADDASQFPLVF